MPRRKLLHYCDTCNSIVGVPRDTSKTDKNGMFVLECMDERVECPECHSETALVMNGGFTSKWVKTMLISLHKRLRRLEENNEIIINFVKEKSNGS